jgi:uncharacterized surface protein with fasciclin (FAS1) repeats
MKRIIVKNKFLVAFAFLAIVISSCSKDDDNNNNTPNTIANIVATDADLTTLQAAVVKGNLTATLSGTEPYTLFAPTNTGFENAGITSADLDALSSADVSKLLSYHLIPSTILAAQVPVGPNAKVITQSGDSVFVTNNSNGVFINGVKVVKADIVATNGVVHKIDNVLKPAVGNIVAAAQADTSLSFLVAAIVHASTGDIDVAGLLSGGTILTVFAPDNNAFRAAGFASIDQINAADPNALAGILAYHVVNGRIFSSDLTDGQMPATLAGATVTIGVSSGSVTVKGINNSTAANVAKANIVATNGVIHVIDQVLLP